MSEQSTASCYHAVPSLRDANDLQRSLSQENAPFLFSEFKLMEPKMHSQSSPRVARPDVAEMELPVVLKSTNTRRAH